MKKLILVCLFAIGISAVGLAQTKTPSERAATLKTALNLTDDQTASVTRIYMAQDMRTDSLKKLDTKDYGAMMKKMAPILMSSNDKIMSLLTPDQAAIFKIQVDAQTAAIKKMLGDTPPKE